MGPMRATQDFNYKVALASGLKSLQGGRLRQAEVQFRYLVTKFPGADGGYRGLAKVLMVAPALLLGVAGVGFAAACTGVTGSDAPSVLVSREGALLAASLAVAATAAHVGAVLAARAQRDDATWGLSLGRDVVLVASGLVMCLFVATRVEGGFFVGLSGIAALGLALAVSVHAVAWQGTARHVARVEALVVAFYAFATRSFRPSPEIDALVGLLYGFSLLGVAVIARRRKIPAVASATRRFAAALPIDPGGTTGPTPVQLQLSARPTRSRTESTSSCRRANARTSLVRPCALRSPSGRWHRQGSRLGRASC